MGYLNTYNQPYFYLYLYLDIYKSCSVGLDKQVPLIYRSDKTRRKVYRWNLHLFSRLEEGWGSQGQEGRQKGRQESIRISEIRSLVSKNQVQSRLNFSFSFCLSCLLTKIRCDMFRATAVCLRNKEDCKQFSAFLILYIVT